MSVQELPPPIRAFLAHHVRSVEQLEILLLVSRDPGSVWAVKNVYDAILSTPQSIERWLEELVRTGLLERIAQPGPAYRYRTDEHTASQVAALADIYRIAPVRVIEAIYQRGTDAAQSFADAFKIKTTDKNS